MQCPKCKAHSLYLENGTRVCGVQGCTFTEFHPISYQNDVRQYQGQKNATNRYTQLYNTALENGGVSVTREGNFDKSYKTGAKKIEDHCHIFKICGKVQSVAEARFASILRIRMQQKAQNEKNQQKEKEKFFSIDRLAAYSLYSACFQHQLFFEDYNIYSRWLKIDRDQWRKLIKQMNSEITNKIDYRPIEEYWHYTMRVCRMRKIDKIQQRAMKQMCQNISKAGIAHGAKRSTTAACVFWQICRHSKVYKYLKLEQICKKSKEKTEFVDEKDDQKYFDCTQETIIAYFKKYIEADLYTKFMPKFSTFQMPPNSHKQ